MEYKVKEHLRKTKKGLVRVKEGQRKSKAKKALVIGAGALTTLGLGALAYKRVGKQLSQKVINKVDNVVSNAAKATTKNTPKNAAKLVTPDKYKTLPDPWLDDAITTVKSSKPLTVPKSKQKLLTGTKYKAETIPDPWDDPIIKSNSKPLTVSTVKEKPLMIPGKGKTTASRQKTEYRIKTKQPETDLIDTDVQVKKKWSTTNPRPNSRQWRRKYKLNSTEQVSNAIDKTKKKINETTLVNRATARNTAIQNQKIFTNSFIDTIIDKPKSNSRRELLKKLTGVKTIKQMQTKNPMQMIVEAGKNSDAIEKAGQETVDKINSVLSTSTSRRGAIKAGAKGAEGAVKGTVKRKLKGKLIGRLTKSLKNKELNPKTQSSMINRYKKLADKLSNEEVPLTTRRKLLEAAEDFVIPGGDAAKKKKALQVYQRVLKEYEGLSVDTGISATKGYVKKKTKNKQIGKAAGLAARLKKMLMGEL